MRSEELVASVERGEIYLVGRIRNELAKGLTLVNFEFLFQREIKEAPGAIHDAALQVQWNAVAGDLEKPIILATFADLVDQLGFRVAVLTIEWREIQDGRS